MSRIRVMPTLLIMVTALIVLFGGWLIYKNYGLVRPLQEELSAMAPVEQVNVHVSTQTREIQVTFKRVPDLMTAYTMVNEKVHHVLGSDVTLLIRDHRTPQLSELYQNYQPLLYEGIAKGNYTEMIEQIKQKARQDGISYARITMDRNNLYIQLEKDSAYLYEVVPYHGNIAE